MFLTMFFKTQNIEQTMHLTMLIAHPYRKQRLTVFVITFYECVLYFVAVPALRRSKELQRHLRGNHLKAVEVIENMSYIAVKSAEPQHPNISLH